MTHPYLDNVIFQPPKSETCRTHILDRSIIFRDSQSEFLRYMKPIDHNNFLSWS